MGITEGFCKVVFSYWDLNINIITNIVNTFVQMLSNFWFSILFPEAPIQMRDVTFKSVNPIKLKKVKLLK